MDCEVCTPSLSSVSTCEPEYDDLQPPAGGGGPLASSVLLPGQAGQAVPAPQLAPEGRGGPGGSGDGGWLWYREVDVFEVINIASPKVAFNIIECLFLKPLIFE